MLTAIAGALPIAAKLRAIYATLGVTNEEARVLDTLIKDITSSGMMTTIIGREFKSVADVWSFLKDRDFSTIQGQGSKVLSMMHVPQVRQFVAEKLVSVIERSEKAPVLLSVLEKVSNAPIPGFGDVDHSNAAHFVAEGVLPMIANLVVPQEEEKQTVVCRCPYCHEVFMNQG